ncbi:tumor necrosis factor receptor superfamily member 5-like [Scleropages formosus]|uniref:tumor necrosis factor receptor superfamily member 5-like n=1 Tax=Scleropages formosus TaxID=113540 RepID=UPI0010FA6AC9|nr:tumor necrosis factor receptor superfamily member 5-like [Scleropages formosus]
MVFTVKLKMWMIFLLTVPYSPSSACGRAQYEINGRCCTKCKPGHRVYRHCATTDIPVCVPCSESTFTDEPHGRRICHPCTACNQDLGLKTAKECTASSDTVCGVLEGNYCTDSYEEGCRAAQKHTTCKPGDFIKHPGTEYNDTVCENCTGNYFSNGSSLSCTPHTRCESKGLPTVKPGDSMSDSECGENRGHMIAGIVIGIISVSLLVGGGVTLYKLGFCPKKNDSNPSGKTILMTCASIILT